MSDRPHCHGDVCITCSDEAVQVRVVRLLEADLAVVDTGQSMEEVSVVLVDAAAPEVTAVEVENLTRERRQQLLQIQPLYTECAVPAAAAGTETRR